MSSIKQAWRDNVINTAMDFVNVIWIPNESNIYHGYDNNGILVNTPDIEFSSKKYHWGWWKLHETNQGVPYNWGGCGTVEDFKTGIFEGKYAGNVPDFRDNGRSDQCIGVDCSGFVTVCWGLGERYTTRSLLNIVTKLDITNLLPGDILLLPGSHVMIFTGYYDESKLVANIIDAARITGKVSERTVQISELISKGYAGYCMIQDN